ncbi:predicted protein [Pyrenophora tritici-repentis Pt-1C-BFP]|uniref:Uncharacterized protein n=1 Tax=Pyrenophora tritici-repentis (strain Pt-1C-BFP) TaxID=426418 RepID=B2WMU7_PYRTR|nr:uncharacterized protein PTRG_11307 [Pyrenophora tritici-repentis Pt-1C-BFP]EDU44357.1 predicted protein [Pyrenophora tritici-repentis Pt-1C-BFP]
MPPQAYPRGLNARNSASTVLLAVCVRFEYTRYHLAVIKHLTVPSQLFLQLLIVQAILRGLKISPAYTLIWSRNPCAIHSSIVSSKGPQYQFNRGLKPGTYVYHNIRHDRPLTDNELRAIDRSFESTGRSIPLHAIRNAIYLGRTRENRENYTPFSEEPCLYLVFPHMTYQKKRPVGILFDNVVAPAFTWALQEYEVPEIPTGAERAIRPGFDTYKTLPKQYEVIAHNDDYWEPDGTRDSASMDAVRSRIFEIA